MAKLAIPLADWAGDMLARLGRQTGASVIAELDGQTLLGERAMLAGFSISERVSAGGGCRLYPAANGFVALNLARDTDRDLLPALFQTDTLDSHDDEAIVALIAACDALALVERGRSMGLAIAADAEGPYSGQKACTLMVEGPARLQPRRAPRVVDLSALWAGPLASHLLWLAGAEVIKVESRTRPDAMRWGDEALFALLNQGKASVALDFSDAQDRQALLSLIAASDIVIEAARPRALAQLGIDAAQIVRTTPGLVWISITGHGAEGEAADWVGFGDDTAVAGGLTAALRTASGRTAFVGDAMGDPLTGIHAACTAWGAWEKGQGGRYGLAMSHIVAKALAESRARNAAALDASLTAWASAIGQPYPQVARRAVKAAVAPFGSDTQACLEKRSPC